MNHQKVLIRSQFKEIYVVILLLIAFVPVLIWMSDRWFAEDSYYSHGILVPIVSFLLVFRKKKALERILPEPSPWGLRVFLLGIILYWASALWHVYFTSGFSLLIIIAGLVLHFHGERTLREIAFPLSFLVFMVPLPIIVVASVCFKLKILAAYLATFILNLIGYPCVQLSSLIKMRHSYVLIEDSCGGLRSLISLTALGSLFAYQLRSGLRNKLVLFISAIPIAVIINSFRIVFLAIVGETWGTDYTQGTLHSFSGSLVFAFAFLIMLALKKILERRNG